MGGHDLHTKISKGHNSIKTVGGALVTILVLSTSSDGVLQLKQVL